MTDNDFAPDLTKLCIVANALVAGALLAIVVIGHTDTVISATAPVFQSVFNFITGLFA